MAKTDWKLLQKKFEVEHARTGISAKDFCIRHGLNYESARRYIKPTKVAQNESALRTAQNAQNHSAQVRNEQAKLQEKVTEESCHESEFDDSETRAEQETVSSGRDEFGRFKAGNTCSVGNSGNPNPTSPAEPGNSRARKHGLYARYFKEKDLEKFDIAAIAELEDELELCRVRLQSGSEALALVMEDIRNSSKVEQRVSLYEAYNRIESGMATLTARIESITRTISGLRIDGVKVPHIRTDTRKKEAEIKKVEADTELKQAALKKINLKGKSNINWNLEL
ncbi:hypothetical protein ABC295_000928 [Vibrio cholerae]